MPEPEVIAAMRRFKAGLAARDEAMLRALARRYAALERALEGQIAALAEEAARRRAAGEVVSRWQVQQWARYEKLIAQLQVEMGRYVDDAAQVIATEQRAQVLLGLQQSSSLVWTLAPGAAGLFDVLPVQALEYLIGLVSDGSPLRAYLLKIYPQAAEAMMDALVQGMGQGWGAAKIAREMRRAATVSLRTAMNTARTETLRAYRAASLAQYQASGLVEGYRRLAAKSTRTCPACLMLDGKWFPLSTPFEEHVCGRCTPVPSLGTKDEGRTTEASWTTGRTWFEGLDAGKQREILGPGLFRAWREGKIGLEDVPVLHEDLVWGNSWQVARAPK